MLRRAPRAGSLDGGDQRARLERLREEVTDAGDAGTTLLGGIAGDEHDGGPGYRRIRITSHALPEAPSVHPRHAQVDERDARTKSLAQLTQPVLGRPCASHLD